VSVTASLCASYLAAGYQVELVARGAAVPADSGRPHEARLARVLALLPTVSSDVEFATAVSPKRDSVLVVPAGVAQPGRPTTSSVMEA
jgi:uncharacterized protein (DUF58 family)